MTGARGAITCMLFRGGVPWAILACTVVGACSFGDLDDDIAVAAADSIVADWVDTGRVPGAVLLVSRAGGTVFERAYGAARLHEYGSGQYADGEGDMGIVLSSTPEAMTMGTVFDLASVTKVMATTMAIMLLVERGVLVVEEPVQSYLPDFSGGGKGEVTLLHLLTHRSGLSQWQPTYYNATNSAEAYAYIRDLPLTWAVGAERHYSDLGFMLLGLVVERVSGQTLNDFLQEELYGPLGLTQTRFAPRVGASPFAATSHGNPFEYRMVHDPDFGYRIGGDADAWAGWRTRTLIAEVNDGNAFHAFQGTAGHAGLFSTAAELGLLLQLLLDEGEHDGRRYMDAGIVDRFLTSTGDRQALGWQLPEYGPATSFAHTGFTGTFVLGVRDRDLAVVLLTNRLHGGVDERTAYPDIGPLQRAVTTALTGSG